MFSIFKKKEIKIEISDKLYINKTEFQIPTDIDKLVSVLGKFCNKEVTEHNTLYIWHNLGVVAYSKNQIAVESIALFYEDDFIPEKTFKGQIFFKGEDAILYYKNNPKERQKTFKSDNKSKLIYNGICVSFWFTEQDTNKPLKLISLSNNKPYVRKPTNKYKIKKSNEKLIEFKDFGFKLVVIQELMYNQNVLKPKFDLYEFVEWYDKREIDLEEEGYEPIEEVTQWFRDLPIPKKFANKITEIYQDGGDDIYLNLIRFAEGYEDYWDIHSSEDLKHFPNLKKASFCYASEDVINEFREKGVDIQ